MRGNDEKAWKAWRILAVAFLLSEGVGASVWWFVMWMYPAYRSGFKAPGAPDATLLAFAGADLVFFIGAAFGAAVGIWKQSRWAWIVLCLHAGAAIYAALYCLALAMLSGGGWLGAILMAPSLIVLPFLIWKSKSLS